MNNPGFGAWLRRRWSLVTLAALLGCATCAQKPPEWGIYSHSASLESSSTPSGIPIEFPSWLARDADRRAEVVAEIDAAVRGFSDSWGEPVRPRLVRVWQYGFEAIPADDPEYPAGLLGGLAMPPSRFILLAYDPNWLHVSALPHELSHLAEPWASHAELNGQPRIEAARQAAMDEMERARGWLK